MKKRTIALFVSATMALSMLGCATSGQTSGNEAAEAEASATESSELDLTFTKRDLDPSYDANSATVISLEGSSASISGTGASVEGSVVKLTQEGTYLVSGTLDDGQLLVEAGDEDKLQIVFAGANITNSAGPALMIENADKCFLTLAEGSSNSLNDGETYSLASEDDNSDAALFSRDDLTINGSGSLSVNGNYKHAIVSKDDLVITGGTFDITSVEDALQGKDALKIADGTFSVSAGDDAFHSELLFYVKDGSIDIDTCYEGYEAQKVIIDGGTHNIYATDDAINASAAEDDTASSDTTSAAATAAMGATPTEAGGAMGGEGMRGEGAPADGGLHADGEIPSMPDGDFGGNFEGDAEADVNSEGGPRYGVDPGVVAEGGNPTDGAADAGAMRGKGTDGDRFESMGEAPGGMGAAPDGMAEGDAGQMFGMGKGAQGGFGEEMATTSNDCLIQINGGTFNITGLNDAIDSNGNIEINGGTLLVAGPASGMDGSLDYDLSAQINGGTMLMVGSVGSTRGMDTSSQAWTIESVRGSKSSLVSLLDASGTVLLTMEAPLAFDTVLVSAESIASGSSFTIQVDSTPTTFTM